jgi:hypothetical protein
VKHEGKWRHGVVVSGLHGFDGFKIQEDASPEFISSVSFLMIGVNDTGKGRPILFSPHRPSVWSERVPILPHRGYHEARHPTSARAIETGWIFSLDVWSRNNATSPVGTFLPSLLIFLYLLHRFKCALAPQTSAFLHVITDIPTPFIEVERRHMYDCARACLVLEWKITTSLQYASSALWLDPGYESACNYESG